MRPAAFADPGSLFDAVGAQFIAFVIAFLVIANYWLEHHRMIAAWAAIDTPTITANLFLVARDRAAAVQHPVGGRPERRGARAARP